MRMESFCRVVSAEKLLTVTKALNTTTKALFKICLPSPKLSHEVGRG